MYSTPRRRNPVSNVDRNQIKRELQNLHISLPSSFLWEPKPSDAQEFYRMVIDYVYEGIQLPLNNCSSALPRDDFKLYSEMKNWHVVLPKLCMFRQCQTIATKILGCEDFTLHDITRPDPIRLLSFCQAFTNFVRFKEDAKMHSSARRQNIDELNNNIIEKEKELKKANEEYSALRCKLTEKEGKICWENQRKREIQSRILATHEKYLIAKEKLMEILAESERMNNKLTTTEHNFLEAKKKNEELLQRAAKSPRRLKKALEDLEISINIKFEQTEGAENKLKYLKLRSHSYKVGEEQVDSAYQLLRKLKLHLENITNKLQEQNQVECEVQELKEKIQKQEEGLSSKKHELNIVKKKVEDTKALWRKQVETAKAKYSEAEESLFNKNKILTEQKQKLHQLVANKDAMMNELSNISNIFEKEAEKCNQLQRSLLQSVRKYGQKIIAAGQKCSSRICNRREIICRWCTDSAAAPTEYWMTVGALVNVGRWNPMSTNDKLMILNNNNNNNNKTSNFIVAANKKNVSSLCDNNNNNNNNDDYDDDDDDSNEQYKYNIC